MKTRCGTIRSKLNFVLKFNYTSHIYLGILYNNNNVRNNKYAHRHTYQKESNICEQYFRISPPGLPGGVSPAED